MGQKVMWYVFSGFGKKKFYTAVVFSKFLDKNYDYELKEIEYIIDDKPCISDYQIKFFSWIADYYMCPIGKVLETALPKLFLIKSETVIEILTNEIDPSLSQKSKNLFLSYDHVQKDELNHVSINDQILFYSSLRFFLLFRWD